MTIETSSDTGQKLYFYLNHPIKWVRLVGLIVSFELVSNRFILILDDFSGITLELTCIRKAPLCPPPDTTSSNVRSSDELEVADEAQLDVSIPSLHKDKSLATAEIKGVTANGHEVDLSHLDIGSIVKVKGGIGEFRGQKQILLERILVVKSTSDEAAAWAENLEFKQNVLAKPWIVAEEKMKIARRQAERPGREGKSKRKMKKKKERRSATVGGESRKSASVGEHLDVGTSKRRGDNESRRRKDAKSTMINDQEEKHPGLGKRRTIEQDDAQRRERMEALRMMKVEQGRKSRIEDEEARKVTEERERSAAEKRRRNEAREQALREMGAGR